MRERLDVDEVTLELSTAQEAPRGTPAPRVLVPEPMLDYRCNLRGCCCGGWGIAFRASDLVRLGRRLTPDDREKLTRDVELKVRTDRDGDRVVEEVILTDEAGSCRFLTPDANRCGLHERYGLEALPDLCVDFPVASFLEEEGVSLVYDAVCPSVMDALAADDGPLRLVERSPPYDEGTALRSSRPRGLVVLSANGVRLTPRGLDHVRRTVLRALEDTSRPPWEHLHALERAFRRLATSGDVEAFSVEPALEEPGPFLRHLGACIGAHGRRALAENFRAFRRFVFAIDLTTFDESVFRDHLGDWGPAYERWLGPHEESVGPLLVRWMAHAFAAPFSAPEADLGRFAGTVSHRFGTALRYAAALGATLARPVDRDVMKVAIGASEHFYRGAAIPPELMPWFE